MPNTKVAYEWSELPLRKVPLSNIPSIVTEMLVVFLIPFREKQRREVHPTSGHEGPDGEYRHSSTLPLTSALDGGGWSTPWPGSFTPRNDPVPIV